MERIGRAASGRGKAVPGALLAGTALAAWHGFKAPGADDRRKVIDSVVSR